jgi:hypothetical protein
MPKQLALWEVPLRKDWDLIAKCTTAIPIVEKTSRRVVMTTADRSDGMLKHARTITSNHNAHVRAERKKNAKRETRARFISNYGGTQ